MKKPANIKTLSTDVVHFKAAEAFTNHYS